MQVFCGGGEVAGAQSLRAHVIVKFWILQFWLERKICVREDLITRSLQCCRVVVVDLSLSEDKMGDEGCMADLAWAMMAVWAAQEHTSSDGWMRKILQGLMTQQVLRPTHQLTSGTCAPAPRSTANNLSKNALSWSSGGLPANWSIILPCGQKKDRTMVTKVQEENWFWKSHLCNPEDRRNAETIECNKYLKQFCLFACDLYLCVSRSSHVCTPSRAAHCLCSSSLSISNVASRKRPFAALTYV